MDRKMVMRGKTGPCQLSPIQGLAQGSGCAWGIVSAQLLQLFFAKNELDAGVKKLRSQKCQL